MGGQCGCCGTITDELGGGYDPVSRSWICDHCAGSLRYKRWMETERADYVLRNLVEIFAQKILENRVK